MGRVIPSKIVHTNITPSWITNHGRFSEADELLGALQFLGNLFEYFLVRRNQGKEGKGEWDN